LVYGGRDLIDVLRRKAILAEKHRMLVEVEDRKPDQLRRHLFQQGQE
jgi:hypothetical protein